MIYKDAKIPTIQWWEWVILWFLPLKTSVVYGEGEGKVYTYKVWRGKTYVLSVGVGRYD